MIAKFEEEYTGVVSDYKVYMIKGVNSNIDEIISYKQLLYLVIMTLLPFKYVIIYDGIMTGIPVGLGVNFAKMVENDYNKNMKYYHL